MAEGQYLGHAHVEVVLLLRGKQRERTWLNPEDTLYEAVDAAADWMSWRKDAGVPRSTEVQVIWRGHARSFQLPWWRRLCSRQQAGERLMLLLGVWGTALREQAHRRRRRPD